MRLSFCAALVVGASWMAGCTGMVGDPLADPPPGTPGNPNPNPTPTPTPTPTPPPPFEPGPSVLARLTATQYRNILLDVFGDGLPTSPLEADTNPYLFYSIGAASTSLSELGVQQYADAASMVLDAVFLARAETLMGCVPQSANDACADGYLRGVGRRLFRRPLSEEEATRYLTLASTAAEGQPLQGLRVALYGMLQSPFFLYRLEVGEPDPSDATRRRYTSFEMAERLSFLIWNTAPDIQLLDAAARGDLLTDEGLAAQARRLLASPRAHAAVQDFFAQYFDLSRLEGLERDPANYPLYSEDLIAAMRSEVRLLVEDFVFRQESDIRQIFSTRRTFVNSDLAELYGVAAPGASKIAFVPVELPAEGPRAGMLTFGAFLAMNAHPTDTSPTLRGKYVRERVLCQSVPAPPPNVDTRIPPPSEETHTLRERLVAHRADPACAGCHAFTDPPGFLFEHFDSIGAYREDFEGYPLDTSGDLDGEPLADARDLATRLGDDARVPACMVKQLYRHASGRLDEATEKKALLDLQERFASSGYRFKELLVALVQSEGFRTLEATP